MSLLSSPRKVVMLLKNTNYEFPSFPDPVSKSFVVTTRRTDSSTNSRSYIQHVNRFFPAFCYGLSCSKDPNSDKQFNVSSKSYIQYGLTQRIYMGKGMK